MLWSPAVVFIASARSSAGGSAESPLQRPPEQGGPAVPQQSARVLQRPGRQHCLPLQHCWLTVEVLPGLPALVDVAEAVLGLQLLGVSGLGQQGYSSGWPCRQRWCNVC